MIAGLTNGQPSHCSTSPSNPATSGNDPPKAHLLGCHGSAPAMEIALACCQKPARSVSMQCESLQIQCCADSMCPMVVTLRLSEEEQDALRQRAELDGASVQETARRAVREYIAKADHRDRVTAAAGLIMRNHADALQRLGE